MMTEDQELLVGDYHDNCWTKELEGRLGSKAELNRLNAHRHTDWTQEMLDEVLRAAIKLRGPD